MPITAMGGAEEGNRAPCRAATGEEEGEWGVGGEGELCEEGREEMKDIVYYDIEVLAPVDPEDGPIVDADWVDAEVWNSCDALANARKQMKKAMRDKDNKDCPFRIVRVTVHSDPVLPEEKL